MTLYIVPIALFIWGILLTFITPKKGSIMGFRTRNTLKDEVSWKVGQKVFAKYCLIFAVVSFVYILTLDTLVAKKMVSEVTKDYLVYALALLLIPIYILTDNETKKRIESK